MSRIDEALRRASAGDAAEPRDVVVAQTVRRPDESMLDRYPPERPASADREVVRPRSPQPVARRVPRTAAPHNVGPIAAAFEGKLVVSGAAASVSVEQYRRLAAAMHELHLERDLKTLMVTSALPREGKTLTVTNLALTLSGSYARRVLLIDADLRRPSIHEVLNLPNTVGLGDVLRSERAELPLRQVSPMLSVLPAGRAVENPMALLTSDRMRKLLDDTAASFDWVLLDAPPVGFMPDAGLLAGMIRAILFVIGAGSTPYHLIQRATAELGHDCIVGTVLNRIEPQNIPATGYYRDYYGGDGSDGSNGSGG